MKTILIIGLLSFIAINAVRMAIGVATYGEYWYDI